jgi:dihydrofolate reductase
LNWFKESTAGGVVVMGRKTWESLPRKPLPGRENIVIASGAVEGVDISISGDPIQALDYIKELFDDRDVWVIGGAQLVERLLPYCDELWLNNVGNDYECDVFLPKQKITELFHWGTQEVRSFGIITKWIKK